MLNNSVKTSTPMPRYVQVLCLTFLWQAGLGSGWAAEPDLPAKAMTDQMRSWLAQTHRANPAGIDIAPSHLQRLCERVGAEWAAARDADVASFRGGTLTADAAAPRFPERREARPRFMSAS